MQHAPAAQLHELSEQQSQPHWSSQPEQPHDSAQHEHEQSAQEHAPPEQHPQPGAHAAQHAAASELESVGADMNSEAVLVARTAKVETMDNMVNSRLRRAILPAIDVLNDRRAAYSANLLEHKR